MLASRPLESRLARPSLLDRPPRPKRSARRHHPRAGHERRTSPTPGRAGELSSDEASFARVLLDLTNLRAAAASDLAQWTRSLERMAAEERALRAEGKWLRGRDDIFGVLGLQRAEIRHWDRSFPSRPRPPRRIGKSSSRL